MIFREPSASTRETVGLSRGGGIEIFALESVPHELSFNIMHSNVSILVPVEKNIVNTTSHSSISKPVASSPVECYEADSRLYHHVCIRYVCRRYLYNVHTVHTCCTNRDPNNKQQSSSLEWLVGNLHTC